MKVYPPPYLITKTKNRYIMLRKTYGVPGKIETVMIVKSGGVDAVINFKGGSIVDFARKPANYSTTNPIHQAIIENSVQFKRGEIKLLCAFEVEGDAQGVAAPKKSDANVKEYPEVSKTQDAIEVLKGLGVDAANLKTKADAKKYAAEKNISFPNL